MDPRASVLRSLELIESRIAEKMTVERIALSAHFSKNHYQRLFREIVGESVMGYVTRRRLQLAAGALLESDASVLDIALDYGYDSRDGFTRVFKAHVGVTPSEYRRHGLAAPTNTRKERLHMLYTHSSEAILGEIRAFIGKAGEASRAARACKLTWYGDFWRSIADRTDALAASCERALRGIPDTADGFARINNRLGILRAVDDAAFHLRVTALHARLTVARAQPDDRAAMQPLCARYDDLASGVGEASEKIAGLFRELTAMIFDDMRKTLADKMGEAARAAGALADGIRGYDYLQGEFRVLADELANMPVGEVTERKLSDILFKLPILALAADTDTLRGGGADRAAFDGIEPLRQSVEDAVEFIQSLPEPEAPAAAPTAKVPDAAGYQGNVLYFYTCGEREKLAPVLGAGQKARLDGICGAIHGLLRAARSGERQENIGSAAGQLRGIARDLAALADELGEGGGPLRVLGEEFARLCGAAEGYPA